MCMTNNNNTQEINMNTLSALFTDVKSFAVFNSKPHLFSYS